MEYKVADKKDTALISVGIPCYDRPEGLRRTLNCIVEQSYRNLEIIISDNCSPNSEVKSIAKEFTEKDIRIKYFRQTSNIGAFNNFRFVLDQAQGRYFMWAADDDFHSPNYIEYAYTFLEQNPDYCCLAAFPHVNLTDEWEPVPGADLCIFDDSSSWKRMLKTYLATSASLVSIYGLIRTNTVKNITFFDLFGSDRFVLAALAWQQKISMTKEISLYRGSGMSSNYTDWVQQCFPGPFSRTRSRINLAKNAAFDVFRQPNVYQNLAFPSKSFLALSCFFASLYDSADKFIPYRHYYNIVKNKLK